jgi:uncharacterized RDD family membrane protein YckC
VTGEAVALDLRPAALPSRLLAGGLDAILQLTLFLGLGALLTAVSSSLSSAADSALGLVLLVLVGIAYPVTFESLLRGRTPGKMALGLRVVRDDGGPVGFRQAFVRGLCGAFIERPGFTFFVAGVLTMALNGRGKRLGDLLAGTIVLQERVAVRGGPVAVMPPQLSSWAGATDLSGLSDELALSVRQFLSRSGELTAAAREDLGGRLYSAVMAAVTPAPPADAPGWAVLSAVLAERRRREELRLGTAPAPWGPTPSFGTAPSYGSAPSVSAPPTVGPTPAVGAPPSYDRPPPVPPITGPGGFVAPS